MAVLWWGVVEVDHSVVLGFLRWGGRWWIFRWCVGEVAIDQIAKPAETSVFNTPGSSQTPKNAYFPLFANKIRNATMKSSRKQ